jgi:hypothetical protein
MLLHRKYAAEPLQRGFEKWRARGMSEHGARNFALLDTFDFLRAFAKGMAEAVLIVLAHRGLPITADQRRRILEWRDLEILERWLGQISSVTSVDELLAPYSLDDC